METCLPKDEFLVAFGDFLVIFYPGMRKNVDVCRLASDSQHRPWHGVSNLSLFSCQTGDMTVVNPLFSDQENVGSDQDTNGHSGKTSPVISKDAHRDK